MLKSSMRIPRLSVLFAMVALWGRDGDGTAEAAETPTPTRKIVITVDDIPGRLEKPTPAAVPGHQPAHRRAR